MVRDSTTVDGLVQALGADRLGSPELQRRMSASQPTISRLLRRAGPRVARIGRGRATRYAAAREVFGAGWSQPLYVVDRSGVLTEEGKLRALVDGGFLVEGEALSRWLRGQSGSGLFDGLPYFLYDLRPAGFFGRQIARRLAIEWGFPGDPRDWSDRQIGEYLLRRGHDLPGNLLLGDAAAARAGQHAPLTVDDRAASYPELARQALADEAPGSSAAGEQPKFAVYHRDAGHVIVKFSPAGETAEAERWRDLLRAEQHALALLREHGVDAVESALHRLADRLYLETPRFDRCGLRGRSGALSLTMVDAEFAGRGAGWSRIAAALVEGGLLGDEALAALVWAETFGGWIGNTDMHPGNVSLSPGEERFELLPIYDMLPMAFAPVRGELPRVALPPPLRTALNKGIWQATQKAAVVYWSRLAADEALSSGFRASCRAEARRCHEVGAS